MMNKQYTILLCSLLSFLFYEISLIAQPFHDQLETLESEMIQLPTRAELKSLLHDAALDEIVEKTGLFDALYHNKKSYEAADPISLHRLISLINSIYDEYALGEGYDRKRVSLVSKSKPLLYKTLLDNYPEIEHDLHFYGII